MITAPLPMPFITSSSPWVSLLQLVAALLVAALLLVVRVTILSVCIHNAVTLIYPIQCRTMHRVLVHTMGRYLVLD
jgi:hypothetical protein